MYDLINLENNVATVEIAPEFDVYTKVIINIDNETQVVAGNDTGLTLEFDNPFGNQDMADRILASLQGFRYSPYTATGALLDPAAEIGDAVQTTTSYGGIYTRYRTFGALMPAEISAPHDEEIDHEFAFETPDERKFKRTVGEVKASILLTNNVIQAEVSNREDADSLLASRITQTAEDISIQVENTKQEINATLSIQASQIAAKVSETGGGSSFGWSMNSTSHTWTANGQEVMKVSATGLIVRGEVQATSGTIGGFSIGSNALTYNGLDFGDTNKNYGAYIGQSGIQLGKNFKVDNGGNVSATNMVLTGTLTIGGTQITAAQLGKGALDGYNWSNASYSGSTRASYALGGAGGGYSFNRAQSSSTPVGSFYGNTIGAFSALNVYQGATLRCYGRFYKGNIELTLKTKTIDGETIYYLGY